eukprot:GFKZ01014190.1.p1 GENE.GFKZ01014190.1~~GFKZ01014190.1.p1  ORF type:complete len:1178 (-),score=114.80 GFKZ01014190.1:1015-4548(-)
MKRPNPPRSASSSPNAKHFRYAARNYNPRSNFPRTLSERHTHTPQQSNLSRVSRKPRLTMCKLPLQLSPNPTPPSKPLRLNPPPLPPPLRPASPSSGPEPLDPIDTPSFSTQRVAPHPLVTPLPASSRRLSLDSLTSNPRLRTSQRNSPLSQSHFPSNSNHGSPSHVCRRINLARLSPLRDQQSASSPRTPRVNPPTPGLTHSSQEPSISDSDQSCDPFKTLDPGHELSPNLANTFTQQNQSDPDAPNLTSRRNSHQNIGSDVHEGRLRFGIHIDGSLGLQPVAIATPSGAHSYASPTFSGRVCEGQPNDGAADGVRGEEVRPPFRKQQGGTKNDMRKGNAVSGTQPKQNDSRCTGNRTPLDCDQRGTVERMRVADCAARMRLVNDNPAETPIPQANGIDVENPIRGAQMAKPASPPQPDSSQQDLILSATPTRNGKSSLAYPPGTEPIDEASPLCPVKKGEDGRNATVGSSSHLCTPPDPLRDSSPHLPNTSTQRKQSSPDTPHLTARRNSQLNIGSGLGERHLCFGIHIDGSLGLQPVAIATPSGANSYASPAFSGRVREGPPDNGASARVKSEKLRPSFQNQLGRTKNGPCQSNAASGIEPEQGDDRCAETQTPVDCNRGGMVQGLHVADGTLEKRGVDGRPVEVPAPLATRIEEGNPIRRARMESPATPPQPNLSQPDMIWSPMPARQREKPLLDQSRMEHVIETPPRNLNRKQGDNLTVDVACHHNHRDVIAARIAKPQSGGRADQNSSEAAMEAQGSIPAGLPPGMKGANSQLTLTSKENAPGCRQQHRSSVVQIADSLGSKPARVATKSDIIRSESPCGHPRTSGELRECDQDKKQDCAARCGFTNQEDGTSSFAKLRGAASGAGQKQQDADNGVVDGKVRPRLVAPSRIVENIGKIFPGAPHAENAIRIEGSRGLSIEHNPAKMPTQTAAECGIALRHLTQQLGDMQTSATPVRPRSSPLAVEVSAGSDVETPRMQSPADGQSGLVSTPENEECVIRGGGSSEGRVSGRVCRRVRSPMRMGWISESESPMLSVEERRRREGKTQELRSGSEGIWLEAFANRAENETGDDESGVEVERDGEVEDGLAGEGRSEDGQQNGGKDDGVEWLASEEECATEPPTPENRDRQEGRRRGGTESNRKEHELVGRSRLVWIRSGQLRSPHSPGSSGEE